MAGRTTFVVANRLSLLRRADVILVLAGGSLVQTGTHEALVEIPGPYRDTALLQLMDSEPEDNAGGRRGGSFPRRPPALAQPMRKVS